MKVKYIGFGGEYRDYPCYKDENGKIYFDINDGRNGLNLYTGAWQEDGYGEIYGEPNTQVIEKIECDEPFIRHIREHDYMMLFKYQSDCNYFLGHGKGYEGHLYFKEVNKHCDEMKKLYNSFSDEEKPEWLTEEQIEKYRNDMLEMIKQKKAREPEQEYDYER